MRFCFIEEWKTAQTQMHNCKMHNYVFFVASSNWKPHKRKCRISNKMHNALLFCRTMENHTNAKCIIANNHIKLSGPWLCCLVLVILVAVWKFPEHCSFCKCGFVFYWDLSPKCIISLATPQATSRVLQNLKDSFKHAPKVRQTKTITIFTRVLQNIKKCNNAGWHEEPDVNQLVLNRFSS